MSKSTGRRKKTAAGATPVDLEAAESASLPEGMRDPMPDGMRPAVDETPVDLLYLKYLEGAPRAVEFMGREGLPLIEADDDHSGKKWCPECRDWRPASEFSKRCGWMCGKHWRQLEAARMRHYRAKQKTQKKQQRVAKRKPLVSASRRAG